MARAATPSVPWRASALVVSESALILGIVATAAYAQLGSAVWPIAAASLLPKALVITSVCQLCLYYGDLYDHPQFGGDRAQLLIRTLRALGATLVILALVYTVFPDLVIARGIMARIGALAVTAVVAWRLTFAWVARRIGPRERLLLVGTSAAGLALVRELNEREELGVQVVGLVDTAYGEHDDAALALLGTIEDIPAIVRARAISRVVVSLAEARGKLPMDKLLEMKLDGVAFDHLASVYEQYTGKIAVENLRPSWLIFSPGFNKTSSLLAAKRVLDIVSASIGLVLAAPIVLLLAIAVKLTSRGPVFYSQTRVGRDGQVFTVHKLRSMRADAERDTGPVWTRAGDTRVTPLGRFMRRTRLDELPQLLTIVRGHMSLVGPRPERPEFVASLNRQIPFYGQRHVVKPGLTGWAQVRYTYGATVEDALEKLQYDLYYIKNMSIRFDLFVMFETIKTVLSRRGV